MFKNLTKFEYKRSTKEAVGFYLAYLLLTILIGGLMGGLVGVVSGGGGFELGLRVGQTVAVLVTMGLAVMILKNKGILNKFGNIMLVVLTGFLAFFGGGLLGLIPAAYLTTKGKGTGVKSKAPVTPTPEPPPPPEPKKEDESDKK